MGVESRMKEESARRLDEGEPEVPSSDSDYSKENEDSASPSTATTTEIDTVLNLTDSSEVTQFLLSMLYPGARRFPPIEYVLLDLAQEPPLGQVSDHGKREHELAATDQGEAEEGGATHDVGVVQVAASRRMELATW